MSRTALELIGQSGLGNTFDALTENSDSQEHPYVHGVRKFAYVVLRPARWGKKIDVSNSRDTFTRLSFAREYVLPWVYNIGTPGFRRWVVDTITWGPLRDMRDIADVMRSTSDEIVGSKRRAMKEGGEAVTNQVGRGKDILSVLRKCSHLRS
jgi:hypothetical protein